jgi:GNAT superfamily N-acetyltransferase
MIRKFFVYYKADGVGNALRFVLKTLLSHIYKRSETVFYSKNTSGNDFSSDYKMQMLELSIQDMEIIDFPRLKLVDYNSWMQKGSRVFVCYVDETPVAFTWTHYGIYEIHGTGHFSMSANECWIGPTFVDRHYRGRGINKQQILYQMEYSVAEVFYTSVNVGNIPSRQSFEHWGFVEIGRTIEKGWLGRTRTTIVGNEMFKNKFSKE